MSIEKYIDKRWELDGDPLKGSNLTGLVKKQFAYRIWREDFEKNQKREDAKVSEIKDTWAELYQLIGFDNVFQGVWFQGVTQLAAQRGCHFSIIPIILSVVVSLATIVGVYLKTRRLNFLERSLLKDRIYAKGLQSCIEMCERQGVNLDFTTIETAVDKSIFAVGNHLEKALKASKDGLNFLLVSLIIASFLLAWLIYMVMCGKYV